MLKWLEQAWCWMSHPRDLIGVDEDEIFVYCVYYCEMCDTVFEDTPFNPVEEPHL